MVNQMVTGNNPQEDSAKNLGDEGLQKLGQEARSQAPSFSFTMVGTNEVVDLSNYKFEFNIYRLPEVSGFRMARKV